ADFTGAGNRIRPPQDLAGFGVERGQAPAGPEFTAGDPAIDDAVEIERRTGDAIAVVPVLDRRLPRLPTGLDVERHEIGVELADEQHPLTHRQPAAERGAACFRLPLVHLRPAFP